MGKGTESKTMIFEIGKKYQTNLNATKYLEIEIIHVMPSIFKGLNLIIYKYYLEGRREWAEAMKYDEVLEISILKTKIQGY
tara:strand:+ start:281 stop:523 length:243 start_codon:yes stop_codon:yes gene_type:complete